MGVSIVGEREGVCLWLTGRSGAGKSTVTNELVPMLEARDRTVTVLDVVPELAKHWAERTSEGKLLRKAFVAREIARHGGIAICVTVSARADVRAKAKELVGAEQFLEIYFDTPAEVSASRKATRTKRTPLIKRIRRLVRTWRRPAGGGSSYQVPESPDLTVDTTSGSPLDNAEAVFRLLIDRGFVTPTEARPERHGHAPSTLDPHDQAG
jgi:sulfate adenylyltransferase